MFGFLFQSHRGCIGGGANAKLKALAKDGKEKNVSDFDDHFDDMATHDWRNLTLNKELD